MYIFALCFPSLDLSSVLSRDIHTTRNNFLLFNTAIKSDLKTATKRIKLLKEKTVKNYVFYVTKKNIYIMFAKPNTRNIFLLSSKSGNKETNAFNFNK